MKVALIGGTGKLGRGLAVRLSNSHEILIGSREESRGRDVAAKLQSQTGRAVKGGTNEEMAKACDLSVLSIPSLEEPSLLDNLKPYLDGKIVISPIVPMQMDRGYMRYSKSDGSAAEEVAAILDRSRVAAAMHNVPAMTMEDTARRLDFDVLVACNKREDYDQVSQLVRSIDGLRPLYVGPLFMSREIEALTPLLLNAAKLNGLRRLSVRFVS